jgi:two-component system, LytTR family, response regulator
MPDPSQRTSSDRIHLKTDGRIVFIPLQSIDWLESAGNYVEVFVGQQGKRFHVRETLSSFEKRLDERCFVRIHRSVIVNVSRIRELRPRYTGEYRVTMDNGKELRLSRGYRENLKRLLQSCFTCPPATAEPAPRFTN